MSRLLIRSVDRKNRNVTSSHQFIVAFSEPIQGTYLVKWATIPNTIYNINASNNIIYWDVSGTPHAEPIPLGNYDGALLATAIKAAMDAPGPEIYTVAYSATTAKFTITTGAAWGFTFGTFGPETARFALGFRAVDQVQALQQTSDFIIFLGIPISIGITIDEAGTRGYWTADQKMGTIYVPLAASFGIYQILSPDVLPQILEFRHPTRELHIRLVDASTNNIVDLNNAEWELLLERLCGETDYN